MSWRAPQGARGGECQGNEQERGGGKRHEVGGLACHVRGRRCAGSCQQRGEREGVEGGMDACCRPQVLGAEIHRRHHETEQGRFERLERELRACDDIACRRRGTAQMEQAEHRRRKSRSAQAAGASRRQHGNKRIEGDHAEKALLEDARACAYSERERDADGQGGGFGRGTGSRRKRREREGARDKRHAEHARHQHALRTRGREGHLVRADRLVAVARMRVRKRQPLRTDERKGGHNERRKQQRLGRHGGQRVGRKHCQREKGRHEHRERGCKRMGGKHGAGAGEGRWPGSSHAHSPLPPLGCQFAMQYNPCAARTRGAPDGRKRLTSFALKIVAIVGMTANHAAYLFDGHLPFAAQCALFAVGGLTFPVMAFLLTEGYRHTSDIRRYALRLGVFALVSQIPYGLFLAHNGNVLFTLLIGLGVLWADDHAPNRGLFWAAACGGALVSLACDWGFVGIVMIYLFKAMRGERGAVAVPVGIAVLTFGLPHLSLLAAGVAAGDWSALPGVLYPLVGCPLTIPLIAHYDGRRGRPLKWFFYAYYPAHIAVLGLAYLALFGTMPPLA